MKFKPPSPKVSAFLIIVVILATISIIAPKILGKKQTQKNTETVDLAIKNALDDANAIDTDNDGLPDWQEEIWKTDKNNPDTDGDGTKDGEEVATKRNPLMTGADDRMITAEDFIENYTPNETNPDSLTSLLSKNLLLQYASQTQNKTFGQTNIAKEAVDQAYSKIQIPTKYPESIFFTFQGNDIDKLQEYTNQFILIQIEEAQRLKETPGEANDLVQSYKNIAYEFSTMAVPADLLSVHAKVTNNFYISAEVLANFEKSDSDPILGLLTIPIYKKISEEQPILLKQIENYLTSNGIILNK